MHNDRNKEKLEEGMKDRRKGNLVNYKNEKSSIKIEINKGLFKRSQGKISFVKNFKYIFLMK